MHFERVVKESPRERAGTAERASTYVGRTAPRPRYMTSTRRASLNGAGRFLGLAAAALFACLAIGERGALALMPEEHPAEIARTPSMRVGSVTSQPIGHYEFCMSAPVECSVRPGQNSRPTPLPRERFEEIVRINQAVNTAIEPRTDEELYGRAELWSYPPLDGTGMGDCEDYVLVKRRMLMERGVSAANLLITVVLRPNGEGHAVLTVRTARGDLILDNLTDEVKDWRRTPYRFLKRQASFHAGRWVDITNGHTVAVASID